ncbi:unnamed protein product [Peniophora sp. CBMAI 1063]|nr:unnamed protein product [Peniophora sp. CBMAI 1063]
MDLTKFTVPQLKALCKEKRLNGYSKLNRQALLDKLAANAQAVSHAAPAEKTSSSDITSCAPPSSISESSPPSGSAATELVSGSTENVLIQPSSMSQSDNSSRIRPTTSPHPGRPSSPSPMGFGDDTAKDQIASETATNVILSGAASFSAKARPIAAHSDTPRPPIAAVPTIPKENVFKVPPVPFTTSSPATAQHPVPKPVSSKRAHDSDFSMVPARPRSRPSALAPASSLNPSRNDEQVLGSYTSKHDTHHSNERSGKRFKPLAVSRPVAQRTVALQSIQKPFATEANALKARTALAHLDFTLFISPTSLSNITLPPSISQRKIVRRWAIVLSGLSNGERRTCARVSRMFRYAVYLSASEILSREYAGSRLDQARNLHPAPTTNWWPYLREREREKLERSRAYGSSFLSRFYGSCPVSERLLGSPDNPKQLTVAFRFLQTRLWFTLSIGALANAGGDPLAWLRSTVVGAQEIVPGEIWQITTSTCESFYVLEATCEVIGHPPGCDGAVPTMRADWMDHTAALGDGKPLLQSMRWAHNEEYERGLSRHWISRTRHMSESGVALRAVGERYTLACVISNSVSGAWMSTTEMAQGLSGPVQSIQTTKKKSSKQTLGLFLPAHHHVESVHFTAIGDQSLHPALAIIQTPAREYFILRDNGMQVGCEEDGVVEMWQKVLGCDAHGKPARVGERITLATLTGSMR